MAAEDDAEFLVGSPTRLALLETLEDGPARPRDLVDALDVSRASVQRNLSAFVDRGWVRRESGTYHLTATGRPVVRTTRRFLCGLEGVHRADSLFEHLPRFDDSLPPAHLADTEVAVADEGRPYAPVEHYLDWLDDLDRADRDRIVGLAPVLSDVFDESHVELIESGVETELVIERSLVERIRSEKPEKFARSLAYEGFELYASERAIEFGLAVCGPETFLGGYDDGGRMCACGHGRDSDLRAWALDRYEHYRETATRVDPPTGPEPGPGSERRSG
jgi:predicted transcriptional regulator